MSNNKFNSKYAAGDIFDEAELESEGLGNIFKPSTGIFNTDAREADPSSLSDDESQALTQQDAARHERPAFSPIQTTSRFPVERPPHYTDDPLLEEGVESIDHSPERWVEKIKQLANKSRARKILDPVGYEYSKQKRAHALQNSINRRTMGATYAYISRTLRESKAHRCPDCNGAFNGGKPLQPNGRERNQEFCLSCFNTGHTLRFPHESLANLREGLESENHWIDLHKRICGKERCSGSCIFGPEIDQHVRNNVMDTRSLERSDVFGKPSGRRWIDDKLRYKTLSDAYKPIARGLLLLGGREGTERSENQQIASPLKKYDVCHFINFDTVNPDGNIKKHVDPQYFQDNEHVFNAGGGGRDKQMFAVIHSVNDNGTYNIIYSARPLQSIREEKREREKGRKGLRSIKFPGFNRAVTSLTASPEGNSVRDQVVNSMNAISPFMGERSPLQDGPGHRRYYKYLTNVPAEFLHRVDDTAASQICYSGVVTQTQPRGKIRGWFKGVGKGIRGNRDYSGKQLDTPVTVDTHYRIGHGFSEPELKQAMVTTGDELTWNKLNDLNRDMVSDIGHIVRKHGLSTDPERFGFSPGRFNDDITETAQDVGTDWRNFEQSAMPKPPKFNSTHGTIETPEQEIEMPLAPPRIDEILSTPAGRNEMLGTLHSETGRADFTPQEEHDYLEGIRTNNHIHGGFEALGIPYEKDEE